MSSVNIVNGPSKFDLTQALFVWKPIKPKVNFSFSKGYDVSAVILSVQSEDGSGESWNIEGYVGNNQRFKAYYRTDRRTGTYTFVG